MLERAEDARRVMREGRPVLGHGWKEVEAFEDLEDLDEYESDEEELYVVMDLGNGIDNKTLLAENSYQLIGVDTPLPFLKLGNQVYQGEAVKMIGDEIIFGRIRNEQDPHKSDRPPWHSTNLRLHFRPVTLRDKPAPAAQISTALPETKSGKKLGRPKKDKEVQDQEMPPPPSSPPPQRVDTTELSAFLASHGVNAGHSSGVDHLDQDLAGASLANAAEAGPSSRRSPAPDESFIAPLNTKKGAAAARVLRKVGKKYLLQTPFDLSILNIDAYWKGARFDVSREVEEQLQPQTTDEHLQMMRERGWTTKELSHALAGRPLKGQGTRPGRTTWKKDPGKGKVKGNKDDSAADDDAAAEESAGEETHDADQERDKEGGAEAPSEVQAENPTSVPTPLFQLRTARADGKKKRGSSTRGRGKSRAHAAVKNHEVDGEAAAIADSGPSEAERIGADQPVEFVEEDEPLVSIDDVEMGVDVAGI